MKSGLCKLHNIGNTCYINAMFQVLFHTSELSFIVTNLKPTHVNLKSPEHTILYYWRDMLREIYTSKQMLTITPYTIIRYLHKLMRKYSDDFVPGTQQDASEFLTILMDIFHTAMSRPVNMELNPKRTSDIRDLQVKHYERMVQMYSSNYSDIVSTFYGMHITELCDVTGTKVLSRSFDPFFILNVSVPMGSIFAPPTLYECLNTLFRPELLDGDNKWIVPDTGARIPVVKQVYFWGIPPIIIINLKKYTPHNKLTQPVNCPIHLDISRYVHPNNETHAEYQLYAVCNHSGGLTSGHYYSCVYIEPQSVWVVLDDNNDPYIVPESRVITPDAVCLFYRKTVVK
jgi:ubiquitin C-terminal hydrolase